MMSLITLKRNSRQALLAGALGLLVLLAGGLVALASLSRPAVQAPGWMRAPLELREDGQLVAAGDLPAGGWAGPGGAPAGGSVWVAGWIFLSAAALKNRFSFTGAVEVIEEAGWIVSGQPVAVTTRTELGEEPINEGDTVRVEGVILPGGSLRGKRIDRIDPEFGLLFDFTGAVQQRSSRLWQISEIIVEVDAETVLDRGVQRGELVRVKGWIQEDGFWLAASIERVQQGVRPFEFTGVLRSKNPWQVSEVRFQVREWTAVAPGLDLGDPVCVRGEIGPGGSWVAMEIERLEGISASHRMLTGTVSSVDPWIIAETRLALTRTTRIQGEIRPGALARAEVELQADGSWKALRIEQLQMAPWFPSSTEIVATVISFDGDQILITDWPVLLDLDEDVQIEGKILPGSLVRLRFCLDETLVLRVASIAVMDTGIDERSKNGTVSIVR